MRLFVEVTHSQNKSQLLLERDWEPAKVEIDIKKTFSLAGMTQPVFQAYIPMLSYETQTLRP